MLILDPSAEYQIPKHTLAPRLTSLSGKRLWFLDSQGQELGKRMNPIYLRWAERLEADYGITWQFACTEQFVSPFRHGKAKFEEIAGSADAIIDGLACCGGGTSAVMHDSVEYEKRGIPTVSLVTDVTLHHARAAAIKLGLPDLHIVTVSHNIHVFAPVATPEECKRAADALYPDMVRALVLAARVAA
jgi:hypothetical protein